jgi:24-methylenesterol C-methyltransferase
MALSGLQLSAIGDRLQGVTDKLSNYATENKTAVAVAGGCVTVAALGAFMYRQSGYKSKPSSLELSGGSIARDKVKAEWDNYESSYGTAPGEGIKDRSKVVQLVDVFYSLVTDIYEWGWGQSFHFSPGLPGKDIRASEAAHEARIAAVLGLKPGMKCLDCGCGVGGPMRTIAATSGAHVTGITINEYQVNRAKYHNSKVRTVALLVMISAGCTVRY